MTDVVRSLTATCGRTARSKGVAAMAAAGQAKRLDAAVAEADHELVCGAMGDPQGASVGRAETSQAGGWI